MASRVFRPPIVGPELPVRETPAVSFADLVRMLGQSIADAQQELDRASAELVGELAKTKIEIIPRITEIVDKDGNISYQHGEPQEVSLLDIGVTPSFYQFSEAKIEVSMDVKIVENETETGTRRFSVFADPSGIRFERKLNRTVTTKSTLSATLVPKPSPLRLEPVRTTVTPEEDPNS